MGMVCRRCDGVIGEGAVANVIRSVVVGECCRRPDEKGFGGDEGELVLQRARSSRPLDLNGREPLGVTPRRVEVLQLAEDGLVVRSGNQVNAFNKQRRVMQDSKSVADVLKKSGLVYWERVPPQGFMRETVKWKLRLTQDGRDWLAAAEGVLSAS